MFNAVLVVIKVVALTAFIILAVPVMKMENFEPFAPLGFAGISAAAASIFFAYVGFDAVSTAAEETKNPQRNMPIGLIGSLVICTVFYLLVASGAIGAVGAQPVFGAAPIPRGQWVAGRDVRVQLRNHLVDRGSGCRDKLADQHGVAGQLDARADHGLHQRNWCARRERRHDRR